MICTNFLNYIKSINDRERLHQFNHWKLTIAMNITRHDQLYYENNLYIVILYIRNKWYSCEYLFIERNTLYVIFSVLLQFNFQFSVDQHCWSINLNIIVQIIIRFVLQNWFNRRVIVWRRAGSEYLNMGSLSIFMNALSFLIHILQVRYTTE